MLRYILLPFLVFSLIIAAIYSLSVLREGGRATSGDSVHAARASISSMDGVRVINTREGRRQWILRSRSMDIAGDRVVLNGVAADMTDMDMSLNATGGLFDIDTGALDLSGGVRMLGEDFTVHSDNGSIDAGEGEFRSEGDVVIEGSGFIISGTGLLARKQEVRILRDVKAVFY